jgi:hypothetical protein
MASAGKSAFYAQFRQIAKRQLFVEKLHALGLRPVFHQACGPPSRGLPLYFVKSGNRLALWARAGS